MPIAVAQSEIDRFQVIATKHFGFRFDDNRFGYAESVLRKRIDVHGKNVSTYLAMLDNAEFAEAEFRNLAQELTVSETYFFRNTDQIRAFTEVVLPERIQKQAQSRNLRLLSAGCASGEEPYSLAMILLDTLADINAWKISIGGVDVNPEMIERAARARYSAWALRETPKDVRERWFRMEGREFVLADAVRRMVVCEEENLLDNNPIRWRPDSYDAIFCRNVLMYFTPEHARQVVARIAAALAPGGYLFLGHAETLRGLSHDFHLCHTHETFYYQRKDKLGTTPILVDSPAQRYHAPAEVLPADFDPAASWVETIQRASDRIRALTQDGPRAASFARARSAPPAAARIPWDLGLAVDLLRKERFADALASIDQLPPESNADPDVLLMKAVLQTQDGKLSDAEATCRALLVADGLSAGAHYLLALCRENCGDIDGAIDNDKTAAYLDTEFAMPHLHLGFLARRNKDFETARRELDRAVTLLQQEDPLRLLFFGGGFNREALLSLCRAELKACGGTD
jgi:chemotaxis protein methyltransferase CheR